MTATALCRTHPDPPQVRQGSLVAAAPSTLLAIALATILTFGWAIGSWEELRLLRLPDNDDMMRLAQVRDWLGGQAFNDLSQHRLGPPGGASLHWSRIADVGPAAMILLLRPLLGQAAAELVMVLTYPALLLLAYLLLLARIAGRLIGADARIVAVLLGALAFPTISLFVPGRIDHHALQIVLMMIMLDAAFAPGRLLSGAVGGTALALSLAVGLETAPEIIALIGMVVLGWIGAGRDEDARLIGLGGSVGVITLLMLAVARPWVWPEQWCDGFTPASSRATLLLAATLVALGGGGHLLRHARGRLVMASLLGFIAAGAAVKLAPVCLSGPYSALDPFLKAVWMRNVSEARDIYFGQDTLGITIAFGGLCVVGLAIGLCQLAAHRPQGRPQWWRFMIFLTLSTAAAVLQIRVTYVVAGIATLPIVAAICRRHVGETRMIRRLALWVVGAGVTYNIVAGQLDQARAASFGPARVASRACTSGAPILVSGREPPGTVMAPLDLGSYLVGITRHRVVAAVYHRNNAGNMAMYRFFLSSPENAQLLARRWGIAYVALCPGNLHESELLPLRRGSLVERLQRTAPPPPWLQPVTTGGALQFYRVVRTG